MINQLIKPLRLGFMVGSESDLPQCEPGMRLINQAILAGRAIMVVFIVNSIHRNTEEVLWNLRKYSLLYGVDRWVAAAGMANQLSGTASAYLLYNMHSTIPLYGAIFETFDKDPRINRKNRLAAIRSITQLPGGQVIFNERKPMFEEACRKVLLPVAPAIILPKQKLSYALDTIEAVFAKIHEVKMAA